MKRNLTYLCANLLNNWSWYLLYGINDRWNLSVWILYWFVYRIFNHRDNISPLECNIRFARDIVKWINPANVVAMTTRQPIKSQHSHPGIVRHVQRSCDLPFPEAFCSGCRGSRSRLTCRLLAWIRYWRYWSDFLKKYEWNCNSRTWRHIRV